jgi:hypothetical protein
VLAHDPQQIAEITIIKSAVPEFSGVNMSSFQIAQLAQAPTLRTAQRNDERASCVTRYELSLCKS